MPAIKVEIDGGYGDDDTQIALKDEHGEIVMWASDEWQEDPSLVVVIANAIRIGYEDGPQALRAKIESR